MIYYINLSKYHQNVVDQLRGRNTHKNTIFQRCNARVKFSLENDFITRKKNFILLLIDWQKQG